MTYSSELPTIPSDKREDYPITVAGKLPEIHGLLLWMPWSAIMAVPVKRRGDGWYDAVVIYSENDAYKVGGYDICLSPEDIIHSEIIPIERS